MNRSVVLACLIAGVPACSNTGDESPDIAEAGRGGTSGSGGVADASHDTPSDSSGGAPAAGSGGVAGASHDTPSDSSGGVPTAGSGGVAGASHDTPSDSSGGAPTAGSGGVAGASHDTPSDSSGGVPTAGSSGVAGASHDSPSDSSGGVPTAGSSGVAGASHDSPSDSSGGAPTAGSGGVAGASHDTPSDSSGGAPTAGSGGGIQLPPANAQFDYQLGGAYAPPEGVAVVSRDREDSPAPGLYNICYVNGFQGQTADESWWLTEHPDLVLHDASDQPVYDVDWNELILDVSTPAKRDALAAIVGEWIEQCASDGFDAVEVDNLDSYSRSQGLLEPSHDVAFMAALTDIAHAAGLAVAQKNSTELLDQVAAMGTDFAIAEECNTWNECGDYQGVYGDLVYVIEYVEQDFRTGCEDFSELSIVLRDTDVSPAGSPGYVYDAC